jgi:hypothetical protein
LCQIWLLSRNPDPGFFIAILEILQKTRTEKTDTAIFAKQSGYNTLLEVETKETASIVIGELPAYHNMTLCVYQLMEAEGRKCENCGCVAMDLDSYLYIYI